MPFQSRRAGWLYPIVIWAVVLLILFVTEYTIMFALPEILSEQTPRAVEAIVDAMVITAVLAPLLWWTVMRPLETINQMRARYLTELFTQIESDRRSWAYELHDGVGQMLTLLISGLRSQQVPETTDGSEPRTQRFLRLAEDALRDVRRLSRGLHPHLLDDLGLAPALEQLVEDVQEYSSIQLRLVLDPQELGTLPERTATSVFRIIQEALTNIVKHSQANHASVTLKRTDQWIHVVVEDDGIGISSSTLHSPLAGHLGLAGMRERTTLLGGRIHIHSAAAQGTRIEVEIPVEGTPNA